MAKTVDVNKSTIMNMLRTDVFGFTPTDIEDKAKEVYHLVGGEQLNGYVRTITGHIMIKLRQPDTKSTSSSKRKKK